MTARGRVLSVFFALLLLAGLATGIREIYYAVFVLGLLLLATLVTALCGALSLRAAQSLPDCLTVRGEGARIQVRLSGLVLLPVTVEVRLMVPGPPMPGRKERPQEEWGTLTLWPCRLDRLLSITVACRHRGVWPAGLRRVYVHDVLGLFSLPLRRRAISSSEEPLIVYPRLYELEAEIPSLPTSADYSENHPVTADHGDSFAGTRLYRDGDSLKRIHWIQTIRTRELYTRQYEISTEQYGLLVLDTEVPPEMNRLAYGDMAGEVAGALALNYLERGCPVRLLCLNTGAGEGPSEDCYAAGREEFFPLYELLATVPYTPHPQPLDAACLLDGNWGQVRTIHLVTSRPSPHLLEILHVFTQRRCQAVCIVPMTVGAASLMPLAGELGVRLVPVSRPEEIAALGDCL